MPVYNAGKYLRPALISIINQTYTNWELIIADDGSTDGCLDNLRELNDSRIILLRDNVNKGIAVRLNQMIDLAKGEYIARMDSDDISLPTRLELQLETLKQDKSIDLLATRTRIIDKMGAEIREMPYRLTHKEICAKPWKGFYMAHPSWMGKAEWFREYRYALPAPYLCEDQDLLLRSFSKSKFATIDKILFLYRNNNNIKLKKLFKTRLALLSCQQKYFISNKKYLFFFLAYLMTLCRIIKDIFFTLKLHFLRVF